MNNATIPADNATIPADNASIPLDTFAIASPCQAAWDDMPGDEKARKCAQCSQHVYNFAAMKEAEIAQLVVQHDGGMCGQFYIRADGTMMTSNCPVGWQSSKSRWLKFFGVAAFLVLTLFGLLMIDVIILGEDGWLLPTPAENVD